jgi:hypothetical protein
MKKVKKMNVIKFETHTPEELKEMRYGPQVLFEPGHYNFEVVKAETGLSKSSGKPMMTMTLKVFDNNIASDKIVMVWDYIMTEGKMSFKVKDLLESVGLGAEYDRGEVDIDLLPGRRGLASIVINKGVGNYQDRNGVQNYLIENNIQKAGHYVVQPEPVPNAVGANVEFDDDIPF